MRSIAGRRACLQYCARVRSAGKKGGYQVEYEDEEPDIHRIFEEELRQRGITCKMKKMVPWCTGEAGAETVKAHFLDEHGAYE